MRRAEAVFPPQGGHDLPLSPGRYLAGEGVMDRVGEVARPFGSQAIVIADRLVMELAGPQLTGSLRRAGLRVREQLFPGEPSPEAVQAAATRWGALEGAVIVGMGGGKVLDYAKAVAERASRPVLTVPTSAATCAAASACAILYVGGRYVETRPVLPPVCCLVDYRIIAEAPPRLLASGIADALAKWEEGRLQEGTALTFPERAALEVARRVHADLWERGSGAVEDCHKKEPTPSLKAVVDANILGAGLCSVLGGHRLRSAAAHALAVSLTLTGERIAALHGETVGFGLLFQRCLLGEREEAAALAVFLRGLGLPLTLADLLERDLPSPGWAALARLLLRPRSGIHHLPRPITEAGILRALDEADALGGKPAAAPPPPPAPAKAPRRRMARGAPK
ncbi:MAG: iron-containing alcohol dehydrogenase [Candidatus Methylomirabilales bacterium]